jgi:hypothetical protein
MHGYWLDKFTTYSIKKKCTDLIILRMYPIYLNRLVNNVLQTWEDLRNMNKGRVGCMDDLFNAVGFTPSKFNRRRKLGKIRVFKKPVALQFYTFTLLELACIYLQEKQECDIFLSFIYFCFTVYFSPYNKYELNCLRWCKVGF